MKGRSTFWVTRMDWGKAPDWFRRTGEVLAGIGKYVFRKFEGSQLSLETPKGGVRRGLFRAACGTLTCTLGGLAKEESAHFYFSKDAEKDWRVGKGTLGLTRLKHCKRDRIV